MTRPNDAVLTAKETGERNARRLGLNEQDAQDVGQECALRYLKQAVAPDNPAAWAMTVSANLVTDIRRGTNFLVAGQWYPRVVSGDDDAFPVQKNMATPSLDCLVRNEIETVLQLLTERERDVLQASLTMPPNEVADRLGLRSPAVVATMISRARAKVRAVFPEGSASYKSLFEHPSLYR